MDPVDPYLGETVEYMRSVVIGVKLNRESFAKGPEALRSFFNVF